MQTYFMYIQKMNIIIDAHICLSPIFIKNLILNEHPSLLFLHIMNVIKLTNLLFPFSNMLKMNRLIDPLLNMHQSYV